MIKQLKKGRYKLFESKHQTKVLVLDNKMFAWINAKEIGEILVLSEKSYAPDCILACGEYRLYRVKEEEDLTDLLHLELYVGEGIWQGYLLTTGLPNSRNNRKRVIPTFEVIPKEITEEAINSIL